MFIERYSRLLPLTSEGSEIPDDEVLGRWLTGGVNVSVSSFRRIHALCGWMSVRDLIDVVRSAGFEVPPGSELLDKPRLSVRQMRVYWARMKISEMMVG